MKLNKTSFLRVFTQIFICAFSIAIFGAFSILEASSETHIKSFNLNDSPKACFGSGLENCKGGHLLLARHRGGRPHGLMHSMGRRGRGICPQPRFTPAAPNEFLKMKNPLESTQDNIRSGKELFDFGSQPTACKVCHGAYGNGMGIMANGAVPLPRNFTCEETMKDISDGQMFYVITHGSQGSVMPAYKNLSDEQVWQLITYIRTLGNEKKGP